MIYLTADLHLGHRSIVTIGEGRPFRSIDEHDRAIIANINDTVSVEDELWILGDVTRERGARSIACAMRRVNCRHVRLVLGNHDREQACLESGAFESVARYEDTGVRLADGTWQRLVLFHYPVLDWDGMHRGSVMLHGHIHSRGLAEGEEPQGPVATEHVHALHGYNEWCRRQGLRRYDVGVDANGYRPVSLAQVLSSMGVEGCSAGLSWDPSHWR